MQSYDASGLRKMRSKPNNKKKARKSKVNLLGQAVSAELNGVHYNERWKRTLRSDLTDINLQIVFAWD